MWQLNFPDSFHGIEKIGEGRNEWLEHVTDVLSDNVTEGCDDEQTENDNKINGDLS